MKSSRNNGPNLILIVLDTVRAGNMSCYGYEKQTTPHLDRFLDRGIFCENAFSPAIWTIPSHASLFTGTYPTSHGAVNLHRRLDGRYTTLAETLSASGYHTIAFANNRFLTEDVFGLSRGFDTIADLDYPRNRNLRKLHKAFRILSGTLDCGASMTNRLVMNWLKERKKFGNPFFLFLNFMEAHAPYKHVQRSYLKQFLSPGDRQKFQGINQDRQQYLTRKLKISEDEFLILRSVYDAQIAYIDSRMAELLRFLDMNGFFENSIIVITSDHGDMIGEHDLMHHSYSVYDELIRVPLILFLPDSRSRGKRLGEMVSTIDLPKTLVDLMGIEDGSFRDQQQGRNLPISSDRTPREYIYAECERPKNEFADTYPDFDFSVYDRQLLTIRSRDHKFIWSSDARYEWYDLANDPGERRNLIEEPGDLGERYKSELLNWYEALPKSDISEGDEIEIDREVQSQLQALGYF